MWQAAGPECWWPALVVGPVRGGRVWGPKVGGAGGAPWGGHQSVIRFDVWPNKINRLRAKMSKRITLCLRGDLGRSRPLVHKRGGMRHPTRGRGRTRPTGHGSRGSQRPLPLTSPCPPMPACSNWDCTPPQQPPNSSGRRHWMPGTWEETGLRRARRSAGGGRLTPTGFLRTNTNQPVPPRLAGKMSARGRRVHGTFRGRMATASCSSCHSVPRCTSV